MKRKIAWMILLTFVWGNCVSVYAQTGAPLVWGVNSGGNILRWTGSTWQQMPGGLKYVSVGADGTVWGVNAAENILRWTGSTWEQMTGGLVQISVGSAQHVWGVNAAGNIYRWTGSTWEQMPGGLKHVSGGADGTVWGVNAAENILRWTGSTWEQVPGGLTQIAVASPASGSSAVASPASGSVVVSLPILSNTIKSPPQVPGGAAQIGGAPSGQPSAITGSLVVSPSPLSSQPLIVSGLKWQPSKVPPAAGSLVCSRGNTNKCGTTKADYVGAYSLNMKCESGFFDPIYGGTCWKCPDNTGGVWIRSATKVTDDDACWRAPEEKTTGATMVKITHWAWECPSGSFWDGYNSGACYRCPDTHPRRTLAAVYANNACATPMNETRPAVFVKFNSCPKPDAGTMGLQGKRLPGKPFLDIAGGWDKGVAAGGCYACPVTDENGNILLTERNGAPIYGNNQGCDIWFNWKPNPFPEPGLSGLAGVKEAIVGSNLLDSSGLTAGLFLLAKSRGMAKDTPAAKDWVAAQWRSIAAGPYKNEALRTLVYLRLLLVAKAPPAERTPGDTELLKAFEGYINARRVYMAQMGLAMYDAWKAYDDATKQLYARSPLMTAFDYGTVPLDFHSTLGATMALGATGLGAIGAIAAVQRIAATVKWARIWKGETETPYYLWEATKTTTLFGALESTRPLEILKFANITANTAMLGAAVISIAGIILQSIAIDQFIAIVSARPKLEAALAQAKQPVTLNEILNQTNGSDQAVYFWAKAMEVPSETEDPQLVALAAAAHQQAQANGYQLQVTSAQ